MYFLLKSKMEMEWAPRIAFWMWLFFFFLKEKQITTKKNPRQLNNPMDLFKKQMLICEKRNGKEQQDMTWWGKEKKETQSLKAVKNCSWNKAMQFCLKCSTALKPNVLLYTLSMSQSFLLPLVFTLVIV